MFFQFRNDDIKDLINLAWFNKIVVVMSQNISQAIQARSKNFEIWTFSHSQVYIGNFDNFIVR